MHAFLKKEFGISTFRWKIGPVLSDAGAGFQNGPRYFCKLLKPYSEQIGQDGVEISLYKVEISSNFFFA